MQDIFCNSSPIQIEVGEWWFNGRIIQEQNHPSLPKYITFPDYDEMSMYVSSHFTKQKAIKHCLENPCSTPTRHPHDYLGGKRYYKIVQEHGNDIKLLFHGINGTKVLPINKWVKAKRVENAMDGVGTSYTSGIHIIDGLEEARKYLSRFRRNDRIIVECIAKGLRKKEKSRSAVYLADEILITNSTGL